MNQKEINEAIQKNLPLNDHSIIYNRKEREIIKEHDRMTKLKEIIESVAPWEFAIHVVIPKEDYSIFHRIFNRNVYSDIQSAINAIHNPHPGGLIWIKEGAYVLDSELLIPNGTKSLTFAGASGLGKTYTEGGGYFGTHLRQTSTAEYAKIFNTGYTNDIRSNFGLTFRDIKFEGPNTQTSIGIEANNVDALHISHCYFLKVGTAISSVYRGTTYPLAEQPGAIMIDHCAFSEGKEEAIHLDKCTQCNIHDSIFWGWGPYSRYIALKGCDKIRIHDNEFNVGDPSNPDMDELIRMESLNPTHPYITHNIHIVNNWVWREVSTYPFIRTVGAGKEMYNVLLEGNIIHHGYSPNELIDSGYIIIGDESYHQVRARDFVNPFSSQLSGLRDHTTDWVAGITRQNKWAPMFVFYTARLSVTGTVAVRMAYREADMWTVLSASYNGPDGTQQDIPLTFFVPSLFRWRVNLSSASQVGQIVAYW